jgi:hypothetical protein
MHYIDRALHDVDLHGLNRRQELKHRFLGGGGNLKKLRPTTDRDNDSQVRRPHATADAKSSSVPRLH